MSHFNAKQLLSMLKKVMKSKKITYQKLCKNASFSESTLKNIFHSNNITLDRLIEICNLIDISFPDLVLLANQKDSNDFSFTWEQEEFFALYPNYYYFFRECYFNKKSLDIIKEEYRINDNSITKYILKLEKLGLLEVHPNRQLKFLVYGKLQWIKNGPWMKHFYPLFMNKIVDIQLNDRSDSQHVTSFPGFFTVSQHTYDNFKRDISEVENKYKEIAFRDSLLIDKEDFISVTWTFCSVIEDVFSLQTQITDI